MKKLLVLLLVLFKFAFAQEYFFDRLVEYEKDGMERIQIYYNTENVDYYLQINDDKSERTADVYDKLNRKIHHFEITPIQEQNGLIYEYKYVDSEKLPEVNYANANFEMETKIKMDDKYYRMIDLFLFRPDEDLSYISADLSLRYTKENQFDVFNLCCLLGFDQWDTIRFDQNFIVVKATILRGEDTTENYRLIDDQVIQFKLKVTEK